MMRTLVVAIACASFACVALACSPRSAKDDPVALPASVASADAGTVHAERHVRVVRAADDLDAASATRSARLAAKADGRTLVVYVGAKWCDACKRFDAELRSGRLDEALGDVTILAFDADDTDRLSAAGYTFRSVPYVALPGPDGRPVAAREASTKDAPRDVVAMVDLVRRGVR